MEDETQPLDYEDATDDEMPDEEKRPVAYLKVLKRKGVAQTTHLVFEGENLVGRDGTCNVCIPVKALSKQHACIETSSDLHFIKDLNSKNKTQRGKMPLKPQVCYELTSGSQLSFAGVECEYHIGIPPEKHGSGDDTASDVESDIHSKAPPQTTTDSPPSTSTSTYSHSTLPSSLSSTTTANQIQTTNETSPTGANRESETTSNILASDTPEKNLDKAYEDGVYGIEQTVIIASDDEDIKDCDSPSVFNQEALTEEMRGSGQTIEPTLLLSDSVSEEVDDVVDVGGREGGDDDGKDSDKKRETEGEYIFDDPSAVTTHSDKDVSLEATLVVKVNNSDDLEDEEEKMNGSGDAKGKTMDIEETQEYHVADTGLDLEQTQAYFITQTSGNSSTTTTEASSPVPTSTNIEQTVAYNLDPESEGNSGEHCEPTLVYNLQGDDEVEVNDVDDVVATAHALEEGSGRGETEEVGGMEATLVCELSGGDERGVATVAKETGQSEELANSEETITHSISTRKSNRPRRRVFFASPTHSNPDDESHVTSSASLESCLSNSQDSEVAKSPRMKLSLKRVPTGDFGSSRTSGLGVAESEALTSHDSPVELRVSGRKRKLRVLDETEDSEEMLAGREEDGSKEEDVKVKEEGEGKEGSEASEELADSQTTPGRPPRGRGRSTARGRGRGKGRGKNQRATPERTSDTTAAVTADKTAESPSLSPAVVEPDPTSASSRASRASAQRGRRLSQRQSLLSFAAKNEAETVSLSSSSAVVENEPEIQKDGVDAAVATRRGRKRGAPDVAADSEVSSTPPSAKRSRLSRQASASPAVGRGGAASGAGPHRILFTGLRYKQGEKVVGDLGGQIVDNVHDCTHLVTEKVMKTVKFLCVLARGHMIVTTAWLDACKKAKTFVDSSPYIVHDAASEREHKFKLKTSIASAARSPLLQGYKVYVTPSVKPPPDAMKDIIHCAGGEMLTKLPEEFEDKLVIISCKEDAHLWQPASRNGIPVYSKDFIVEGVLKQEILISTKLNVNK